MRTRRRDCCATARILRNPERYDFDLDRHRWHEPSRAPGVLAPYPGGVTFAQAQTPLWGLVRKGGVVGLDVVEITPRTDINAATCITAGRLIANLFGAAVRAGWFDRRD